MVVRMCCVDTQLVAAQAEGSDMESGDVEGSLFNCKRGLRAEDASKFFAVAGTGERLDERICIGIATSSNGMQTVLECFVQNWA